MYITLQQNDFVKIKDKDNIYYGGNQAWYSVKVARKSACGTIAATNILIYLSMTNKKYTSLYSFDNKNITKYDYKKYMNEVYEYLYPINVNGIFGVEEGSSTYNFLKSIHIADLTIGIPTVNYFCSGVKAFVRSKNVEPLNINIFKGRWETYDMKEYIVEALRKNIPIAMLNVFNKNLKNIAYNYVDGRPSYADFDKHWVTITGIRVNDYTKKISIEVSSWGTRAVLYLDDIASGSFLKGMVYLE